MNAQLPLFERPWSDPIAILNARSPSIWPPLMIGSAAPDAQNSARFVTVREFLTHVTVLAEQLPAYAYVLNLTSNRYLFLLGFCAALLRGQTNLLPPNKHISVQEALADRFGDVYILHDGVQLSDRVPAVDFQSLAVDLGAADIGGALSQSDGMHLPQVPENHLAAVCFTSGSTGASQAIEKPWRTFVHSARVNRRYMLPDEQALYYQLATVPPQHMWGLETTILLPLFSPVCLSAGKPLYPQDVCEQLCALPSPRMLVSTPAHLRALNVADLTYPEADILSATAPLPCAYAAQAEQRFRRQVREIYGCSEAGSMAVRRTVTQAPWQLFNCFAVRAFEDQSIEVTAPHLAAPVRIQDRFLFLHNEQPDGLKQHASAGKLFQLLGRSADLVDIAGKRGSLAELNQLLMSFPQVVDGVVFMPEETGARPRLAALVVLMPGATVQEIKTAFQQQLDPVMVPRRIFAVPSLPREESGKLSRQRVQHYFDQLRAEQLPQSADV